MSTPQASTPAPSADTAAPRGRRTKRLILLVVVPLLAGIVGLFVYLAGGRHVETDNAYVKADKTPVSAEVSGTVKEVLIEENEPVKAGQVLFRLDAEPFRVAVAKAEAKLAQVRTQHAAMRASYREKQAEITLARTRLSFANREEQRQADLAARNFISGSRLDVAKQDADLARQQIVVNEENLRQIAETLGGGVDVPLQSHPDFLAAQAELDRARLDLKHTEIRAATAGTASKVPQPGQYVSAGSTAMALVASDKLWIEANFPETDLTWVRPEQAVSIRIDTYPDAVWHGQVESLSPATGAEFSLIPAQNATGNWVKITQRVPVRIALDARPDLPPLRAGLSAVVEIDTGHRRRLFGFAL
jgi:membrane fusion protein (multidrug efflux system)